MRSVDFIDEVRLLAGGLDSRKSEELLDLLEDRAIWDQMALRVSRFLRQEVSGGLGNYDRQILARVLAACDEWLGSELDDLVYEPARRLAQLIRLAGRHDVASRLDHDLKAASTGGEAVMSLNRNLNLALDASPPLNGDIRARARFLLRRLEGLEGGWLAKGDGTPPAPE